MPLHLLGISAIAKSFATIFNVPVLTNVLTTTFIVVLFDVTQ